MDYELFVSILNLGGVITTIMSAIVYAPLFVHESRTLPFDVCLRAYAARVAKNVTFSVACGACFIPIGNALLTGRPLVNTPVQPALVMIARALLYHD